MSLLYSGCSRSQSIWYNYPMQTAEAVRAKLTDVASDQDAVNLAWFFKTGPGEYGEGDLFIGVRMPAIRLIAHEFSTLPLSEISNLVESAIHEERMTGLVILTLQAEKAKSEQLKHFYEFYLEKLHDGYINNWDLIDLSCIKVVGHYLENNDRSILYELAHSTSLWERRVAIITTFRFIANSEVSDTIKIAEILLHDKHDLIHKASGWMLREAGKRVDVAVLTDFLDAHVHEMPRTMLRYAIEKLPETTRQYYLHL